MNRRTIKHLLEKKVENLVASMDDDAAITAIRQNTIISGGAIVSMLLGEPINDYDIYFTTVEAAETVARYFVQKFMDMHKGSRDNTKTSLPEVIADGNRVSVFVKSSGIAVMNKGSEDYDYFEALTETTEIETALAFIKAADTALQEARKAGNYIPVVLTTNAISLSNKTQLVLRFTGEPDEIHRNFDFVHATSYWITRTGELVLNPAALESIMTKNLVYVGSLYPVSTLVRARKFIQRGWTISAGQLLKVAMQISELDLSDPEVLQEQLTGVDVAYFHELIGYLKRQHADGQRIDKTYLVTLVDQMFGDVS